MLHEIIAATGIRGFSAFAFALWLTAACVAGCGTASASKRGWAYIGTDAMLRSPPPIPTGDYAPQVREQRYREIFEAWQQRRRDASQSAEDRCARDTGDSATPGFLIGHSKAFVDCMNAHGWTRVSDPL